MPTAHHLLSRGRALVASLPAAARLASRGLARVSSRAPLRLTAFALLALLVTWPWLVTGARINEFRDAHVLAHYESVAALEVLHFAQAPLWDPYYCGGMYLLGTPQARFASPPFLLTLLFGEPRGAALTAFAMTLVALEGAYRYARARGALAPGAFLAAPVFGLSGVFPVAASLGWVNFFGFGLLPWVALGTRRALGGGAAAPWGIACAALGMAFCIGFGGTYAAPMAALFCAVEGVSVLARQVRRPRRLLAVALRGALLSVLVAGASAVRLWPVMETLRDAPRVVGGAEGGDLGALASKLFDVIPKADAAGAGVYFVGAAAAGVGLCALLRRGSLWLLLEAGLWVWIAAGYTAKPSLFDALRQLPLYGALRYPERFLVHVALVASVLAAIGLTRLQALARSRARLARPASVLVALAVVCLLGNLVPEVLGYYRSAASRKTGAPPVTLERPFHQARGDRWGLQYYAPMARGSLSCWDAYPVPQSPLLRGDLEHEARLDDATAGSLTEARWSPNRLDFEVELTRPARLLVNQNWHSGWHASTGGVANERGLLAVDLPAGAYPVTLRFLPRSGLGGAFVSLAALLAIVAVVKRPRLLASPRGAVLVGLAPLAALGLILLVAPESRARPPLVTPDGDPIAVPSLDPTARVLGVVFEGGLTLRAVRVEPPAPVSGGDVTIELSWQRLPRLEPGLGIFVHLEPSKGKSLNADHALLSQTVTFDAAPAGPILRDVIPLRLPENVGGTTWKVWLGVWRVQRGGDRVKVLSHGVAEVAEDRVFAGAFTVR